MDLNLIQIEEIVTTDWAQETKKLKSQNISSYKMKARIEMFLQEEKQRIALFTQEHMSFLNEEDEEDEEDAENAEDEENKEEK